MNNETIMTLAGILGTALMFLLRQIFKDRAEAKADLFRFGVDLAFNVVNDIAKRTPNQVDDKIALGLDVLRKFLATHDVDLKPIDEERAKMLFSAMNGAGK